MAVDVHEAVYQRLIEVLGCPDTRDEHGLRLRHDDPNLEEGGLLHVHYLVVRDGLISREKVTYLGPRIADVRQFDVLDLCDPDSLDFQAIRDLAR